MKRIFIGAVVLALFALLVPTTPVASALTKPLVLALLHGLGVEAVDLGEAFEVGGLNVPWTRDCAGADLLLLLPAIAIWVTRHEPWSAGLLVRLAVMLPAAILANGLRVLSLIGWRMAVAPSVESPQVHYFLGLVWLVPFVVLVMPRGRVPRSQTWLDTAHAAVVVALLPGLQGVPHGWVGMVSAVFLLSQTHDPRHRLPNVGMWLALWALAGGAIAAVRMESFWLPWALAFPPALSRRGVGSPSGLVLLGATHAILLLMPGVPWVALAVLLFRFGSSLRFTDSTAMPELPLSRRSTPLAASSVLLLMPFLATLRPETAVSDWGPPDGVLARPMKGNSFAVGLPGHPRSLGMVWFGSENGDRHHSVTVCMKYRGVSLVAETGCPSVFGSETHWFREFFLHEGRLLESYADYLKHSFRPGSAPGVHLIAVIPKDQASAETFDEWACDLARGIHEQVASGDATRGMMADAR